MEKFLDLVLQDLQEKSDGDLSRIIVVFPGKRASLFMNNILARHTDRPAWAPRYTTIADLYHQHSEYQAASSTTSICLMHKIYSELYLQEGYEPKSLDSFWGWGEIILRDFDDIDKHMVDASSIYRNVDELRQMDDTSYLTDRQLQALCHFFREFANNQQSRLQGRFLSLWGQLGKIYTQLQSSLMERKLLYEGALQRRVAQRLKAGDLSLGDKGDMYAFVGFNVLNPVEIELMKSLQREGRALFYWDYDVLYQEGREWEAGEFLREAIKLFPSALPPQHFDNLSSPLRRITYASAQSDNIQARYLTDWVGKHLTQDETDTAIVLCDEHLLQPVLHSIPTSGEGAPQDVNITMGFPLKDTPIYGFIDALLTLQLDGYDTYRSRFRASFLRDIQRHPCAQYIEQDVWQEYHGGDILPLLQYIQRINGLLGHSMLGGASDSRKDVERQLYVEAVYRTNQVLQNFIDMARDPLYPLQVSVSTMHSLLRRVLGTMTINFHGEPARGMQVIGVLETRCLDFRHVLLLGVGEGTMPRDVRDTSFIPLPIREAYELTTPRHRIAVNAYYLFRLLQRAEDVTLVYNCNNTGNKHHEISRFMRQLEAFTQWDIQHVNLRAEQMPSPQAVPTVQKTPQMVDQLLKHSFSPTAINCYIDCPRKYYYQYVALLKEEQEEEDGINSALLGTIFHAAAQFLYERMAQESHRVITTSAMQRLQSSDCPVIEACVDLAFLIHYFHEEVTPEQEAEIMLRHMALNEHELAQRIEEEFQLHGYRYSGLVILQRDVIVRYMRNLVSWDKEHGDFELYKTEEDYEAKLDVSTGNGPATVRVKGRVDRMDIRNGVLTILDYKTGRKEPEREVTVESLFEQNVESGKRAKNYLQALLYCMCVQERESRYPMRPALFHINQASSTTYSPLIRLNKEEVQSLSPEVMAEFRQQLRAKLEEMLSCDISFYKTAETKICGYCAFANLCGQ